MRLTSQVVSEKGRVFWLPAVLSALVWDVIWNPAIFLLCKHGREWNSKWQS